MKYIFFLAVGVAAILAEEVPLAAGTDHYPSHGYDGNNPSYSHGQPSYTFFSNGYRWKRNTLDLEAPMKEGLEVAETKHYKYRSYSHPCYSSNSYGHPSYSSYGSGYRGRRDISEAETLEKEGLEGAATKHKSYRSYQSPCRQSPSYGHPSYGSSYGMGYPSYGSSYGMGYPSYGSSYGMGYPSYGSSYGMGYPSYGSSYGMYGK
ncbi:shematrin-like protein 1 [Artemia franciscana]|uniref:shematrin-like protein 1 n=1 Tax=Artemia franciscana TaxID=6661 RepID=UPI0032DA2308